MKKVLDVIEAIKSCTMLTGIGVLFGCGILVLSGLIDIAVKSAIQYVCLYVVIAALCCTIESIIKAIKKIKKDDEEDEEE